MTLRGSFRSLLLLLLDSLYVFRSVLSNTHQTPTSSRRPRQLHGHGEYVDWPQAYKCVSECMVMGSTYTVMPTVSPRRSCIWGSCAERLLIQPGTPTPHEVMTRLASGLLMGCDRASSGSGDGGQLSSSSSHPSLRMMGIVW